MYLLGFSRRFFGSQFYCHDHIFVNNVVFREVRETISYTLQLDVIGLVNIELTAHRYIKKTCRFIADNLTSYFGKNQTMPFRLSAKTEARADHVYQSSTGDLRRTLLKDKVPWHLYEGRSCYENQFARIQSSGNSNQGFCLTLKQE